MSLDFEGKLANYAELAVKVGVGLQPGQRLFVRASVEVAPLVRLIVDRAYLAGARLVEVLWSDDAVNLSRFANAPADSFDELPIATADALLKCGERGDAVLSIHASHPALLKDQDPKVVARTQRDMSAYLKPFSRKIVGREINWNVIAAPIPSWAKLVYPNLDEDAAVAELWETVFRVTRTDRDDPVAAWREHLENLKARRRFLNGKQYVALRYQGPGTDFEVGLPENHIWLGGQSDTSRGIPFVANLPTEEVFTMPHREKAEGTVRSTKPLSYGGKLIEDFSLRFEGGRIVEIDAARNGDVFRHLIDTDEGAARLGEVALVPQSSPIAASGILFYNTLFDENASSHLAVGKAYRTCVAGGAADSDEGFMKKGGNESLVHVDFMVGAAEMNITGVLADGSEEPVMIAGEWAARTVANSQEN